MTEPPLPATAEVPLRVLVADDEESMRHFVQRGLRRLGHAVAVVDDGEGAVAAWRREPFDLAVLDLKMPGTDGMAALHRIRAADPEATIVLMTAHGTVAIAVEAMHAGAADFVLKPFSIEELQVRLGRALALRRAKAENRQLRAMIEPADGGAGLVGQSPAMRELLRQLDLLRTSDATVLIAGESGTGKGLVAKALHLGSARAGQPFVAMNCAAVPDTLVESELFGHEPGAFTGARAGKTGLLSRAHRGTLFLDEIADMSPAAQAKIERFLQEREFLPLGATKAVHVDVRVVAATNRDLPALAATGRFRPELLWRLDVVGLRVPPLRERREDVPLLLAQNLRRLARPGAPSARIAPEAAAALAEYDWPGNVRQLENVVERMVVMAGERAMLEVGDLPPEIRGGTDAAGDVAPPADDYESARVRFDRLYFDDLLRRCGGSITAAAQRSGISRGHLHRRLRELGCDAGAARAASRAEAQRPDLG
ncbi:MAG: sigma-54-dependent Fis family transcriptional regulator [Planctomycetes bacterium]|nr:sigma-54-dependent Fis family transcriptional regulator [Planctomycetota bacterium]